MHELGIMTGVLDSATAAAKQAGALKLLRIDISIGEMTEAIQDALEFAFEVLKEQDPFTQDAELTINYVHPKSRCLECGTEFEHDRFHLFCPQCDSFATQLIAGREMQIDSIEVDLPDED